MATDATFESDKSIGLAVVLGVLALAGALVMLAVPNSVIGALGFAAAMTIGSILVVALHVYE
jgi:hypothetical protein